MVKDGRMEWADKEKSCAVVYWRKPEEWANAIYDWIDSTGQKSSVLTLYEISQGSLTTSQDFHGMEPIILRKSLEVLVKRGSAQLLGTGDEMGVKFF